jgi:hypothetical protein
VRGKPGRPGRPRQGGAIAGPLDLAAGLLPFRGVADRAEADYPAILARLASDRFRRRFVLTGRELAYLQRWGLEKVLRDAGALIGERVAPAAPRNDGRQTPWRNHPVFVAQHATATCCRGCLETWHGVAKGHALDEAEMRFVVGLIGAWLSRYL